MTRRGALRFVEDLLANRRPHRFIAEAGDEAEIRTAITLRAARPGSGLPSEEFVAGLHRRLAEELEPAEGAPPRPVLITSSRRRFVQVGSVAAAAAAVGAGVDQIVTRAASTPAPDTTAVAAGETTLVPNEGEWRTVAASTELDDGSVRSFDLGTVVGFVGRTDGQVRAVSGVCTHLGCRLALDPDARRLNCPCHNAAFAVTGELLRYQLAEAPQDLPRFEVRETDGAVQVWAPPGPAV